MIILDKNLWLGKNKFSEKPIEQHNDILARAIQLVTGWEVKQIEEVLETETISKEEKQEVIEKNSKYKAQKMDEASNQFKKQDSRLSSRIGRVLYRCIRQYEKICN